MNIKSFASKYLAVLLFALYISPAVCRMQPVVKDGRYYYSQNDNYKHIDLKKALSFLGRKMLSPEQWKKVIVSWFYSSNNEQPVLDESHIQMPEPMQSIPPTQSVEPLITWIGHASFLIQVNGFNILTDPIFGDVKAGPFTITKRAMQPGIKLEDLPRIDAIVISHNHSDHTDTRSLQEIQKKYDPVVYVPEGDRQLFESFGFTRVVENTWWDSNDLSKDNQTMKFTFLPAYHWSIRFSLGSYRKSLWGSWMMTCNDINIYFAGDSAYGEHFKEIAQDFPSIDVAVMPIGPTDEKTNRHKHAHCHVDAKEAIDAFIDLDADCFIPMHYGTFFISKETKQLPISQLHEYWEQRGESLEHKRLIFARCGQQYEVGLS